MPVFPHSLVVTIHLDSIPIKALVDTGADVTITTKRFPYWRFWSGLSIMGVGGQQAMNLEGNQESLIPAVADIPHNLWGRDILEDIVSILTMNNCAFFDDVMQHDQVDCTCHKIRDHPQF